MNYRSKVRYSKLALGLAIALASAPAMAQNTTANIGGRVTAANEAVVAGAQVTITHVPTGTVSQATTDASGRYAARGLRVGGPYLVTITKDGQTETVENVFLQLAETTQVNAEIGQAEATLDTVEVTADNFGVTPFSSEAMGAGTIVTRQVIDQLPSTSRNIQDYIRLDPRIAQTSKSDGSISVGGQNTRYNLIKIDGVGASDPFGLEANNLPTERQPVSLDAIEEINIDVANYDVTIAGGTGAVINAVTKSGTNEFGGTVYYTMRDGNWVGEDQAGRDFTGFNEEETYGFTFGGPILKDRLFFFANYEKFERGAQGAALSGTPFGRGLITAADIQQITQIAQRYGINAGGLEGSATSTTEIEEKGIKIDWNISDSHRAAIRYNEMEQTVPRFPGIAAGTVSLSSYWYDQPKTFESLVGEVFSDWSDVLSTEFKVSTRDYDAVRVPATNLPSIRVNVGNNGVFLGTEQNTHVNRIATEQFSAFGAANLFLGDHTLKFGFDYEENDVFNFFGRNLNGVYTFNSIADFSAGRPATYLLRTPRPNGGTLADIPATYTSENLGLFVQDTWAVNYNLTLNFGIRADRPDFSEQRLANARIQQLYGLDNTNTVDFTLIQPRFGFNYTFDSDRQTQLRGGLGLFAGAAPNVWIAGVYQNTGLNFVEYDLRGAAAPNFSPNVPQPNPTVGPSAARQNVDILAPDFELPSVWKANLALDHELPWWGMIASAELVLTSVESGIFIQRLDTGAPTVAGQDGRMIYWNAAGRNRANANPVRGIENGSGGASNRANRPSDIGDVLLVRNTDKGQSKQLTLSLQRPMEDSWAWSFGYTFTDAQEVSPLTSSINNSNWNNQINFQHSEEVAQNSRYAIRDRLTGTLTYQKAFFGDNRTTISMFYEGRSGRPFSYIYFNDINGDGAATNDLFYVPAGPGDVIFTGGAAMETAFFEWLAQNPELAAYRGRVTDANAFRAGWVNNFDLRISQEIPAFFDGHKAEISLDIMNVGNLINKDWGVIEDYGFFATRRVVNYAGIENGRYVYTFNPATVDRPLVQEVRGDDGFNTGVSRWSAMLGFKYKF